MSVKGHHRINKLLVKWTIYFTGLLIMALGIVLIIKADLGASPWDVLHIGLFKQIGFTIGTWSILVGFVILGISSIMLKALPQLGAFLNMLTVGVFIDMYMAIPFLVTPGAILGKVLMLLIGIIVSGYGIGIYISSRCGAGPRDSLMIALTEKTGMKVQYIRAIMEIVVLSIGWLLGGPVFIGTVIFSFTIGIIVGYTLPRCQMIADNLMNKGSKQPEQVIHFDHFSNSN
ncbi:YczE/YyaS/YitT family protein [Cytobacillus luteolus]|uniref:YczE/YyaS/YitT family protein n=1 Tax=Litchfieldia luteola TaxID=682179 RepID=UPI001D0BE6FC